MDEVHELRSTVRDLVALSMMSAAWIDREPADIAAGLADILMTALQLDFVFVRLRDPHGDASVDVMRGDAWQHLPEWLDQHSDSVDPYSISEVIPDVGLDRRKCRGLVAPIGVNGEGGVVILACDRLDFPNSRDRLLLSVAASQAAVSFQTARFVHERQEELREAQAELAHVTRIVTLNELAASIAHETNQPLAAISANASASLRLLSIAQPDLQLVREALHDIVTAGKRAAAVMQRLRELTTRSGTHKAALMINDVISEVIALVRSEVRNHKASLRLSLSSALPPVIADRVQLQQVIINLLMNGLEAMDDVRGRARELVIRTQPHEAHQIRISVEDSGVGIAADDADRLFRAFFTTKPAGMGLGLSISRSIIESHGGTMWATSNPHYGATFHCTLPVIHIARGSKRGLRLNDAVWKQVLPRLNQSPTESRPEIR